MTIACTRCGATCEGDIILPALAFGFKHNEGCGHGVGPLAVLPGSYKPKAEKKEVKEEIKVEEKVEKTESRAERRRARQQKE